MGSEEWIQKCRESYYGVMESQIRKRNVPRGFSESEFDDHKIPKLNFGDWILLQRFEAVDDKITMTYPQIAIFRRFTFTDQALTLEFMEPIRTWMYHKKYNSNPDPRVDAWMPVSESILSKQISEHVQWGSSSAIIYAAWQNRPDLKELIKAYRKTHWFKK